MTDRAPSAVRMREMASLAWRTPWFKTRRSVRLISRMAKPAALSAALLILISEARRATEVASRL